MRNENDVDPFLGSSSERQSFNENESQPWVNYLVGAVVSPSVISVIILLLLLFIPITVLVVGINYHDPHYCPIEPHISTFLIVHGSVLFGWIIFTIIPTILAKKLSSNDDPYISGIIVIILSVMTIICTIFLIIWTIVGSIWTFNVFYWVTYYYDTKNNFYPYNYCQPELYRFTFVYIILSYIFVFLQICYYCFNNMFNWK
ncbi:unnamed protein product [Adineta steineri]|uniref:Uncharacterized protein n=1 Tax=Adineta steineri TaxID=433720 RepID=A0A819YYT5_9BILA|nr:unnamed protein product [Adineta steineri]CAF4164074.1 unnamed protein product [Adineta steineri]